MSGFWCPAGMNETKPLREDTRIQLLGDSTHSSAMWRKSCGALGSSRWTIESRTSYGLLRDRARRNRCRGAQSYGAQLESRGIRGCMPRSRKSSASALNEARILLGAGAGTSRIFFSGKPIRADPTKADVPLRLPLDIAEVLGELEAVRSGSRRGSNGDGIHRGSRRRRDQEGKGSSNWTTRPPCSAFHAPASALEKSLRRKGRECGRT